MGEIISRPVPADQAPKPSSPVPAAALRSWDQPNSPECVQRPENGADLNPPFHSVMDGFDNSYSRFSCSYFFKTQKTQWGSSLDRGIWLSSHLCFPDKASHSERRTYTDYPVWTGYYSVCYVVRYWHSSKSEESEGILGNGSIQRYLPRADRHRSGYDACTAMNMELCAEDDDTILIGIAIGVLGTIVMLVLQIIPLNRFNKAFADEIDPPGGRSCKHR